MDAICYSLHNLIEVVVDTRVHHTIIKAIDFQLGYFKNTGDQSCAFCQIVIKPYSDFSLDPARTSHSFQAFRGIIGQCLDDPNKRLAVEKEKCGYTIYADRKSFPINLFIQLLLVEHGMSLIAAAAITDVDGRATLLPGAGQAGKSVLSVEIVKQHNYLLLGDDTVCLSEHGDCLSFPRTFQVKEYDQSTCTEITQRLKVGEQTKTDYSMEATARKALRFVQENAPLLGLLNSILHRIGRPDLQAKLIPVFSKPMKPPFKTIPIGEIVGAANIAGRGSLEQVVYLERYSGTEFRIESIVEDSLCRRIIACIHNEWAMSMRLFFTMGMLGVVDLPAYFNRVASIIRSGLSNKSCYLLLIPENASPSELVGYYSHHFDHPQAHRDSIACRIGQ